ncbi:MAG: adenylyltransferase/cytidyltransferase family protein [Candidatus Micrarchaeaceae archaeon]
MHRHIGIYAGTFDPIHTGHVAFALSAQEFFGLNEVIFLPEAVPRNKLNVTALGHRIALIQHETAEHAGLRVGRLRARQFTVRDALPEIYQMFGCDGLVFLFGSDVVPSLVHWEGIATMLSRHVFVVGLRGQDSEESVDCTFLHLQQEYSMPVRWATLQSPSPHTSSSKIKQLDNRFVELSDESREYIAKHGLYL